LKLDFGIFELLDKVLGLVDVGDEILLELFVGLEISGEGGYGLGEIL
jgi:hypothetical protein